jgi:hypothetical protein
MLISAILRGFRTNKLARLVETWAQRPCIASHTTPDYASWRKVPSAVRPTSITQIKEPAMSDEPKKKPEEIVESVETSSPEPPKALSESDLKEVAGGAKDGSLDAGIHFKYDIRP